MKVHQEPEYGIVGAGAVSASLVGQLPRNGNVLGPVAGVSYRVASRIANTLKAGYPVRSLDELNGVRLVLFYSPAEHFSALSDALASAPIQWSGKSLIFCDCPADRAVVDRFRSCGASVARLRQCAVAGHLAVDGHAPAAGFASRLARELKSKPVEITEGSEALFDAAQTMATAALTPLIEGVARNLRLCGMRDADAVQLASALFARTAQDYAHSGKQSWAWHIQQPDPGHLQAQLDATGEPMKSLLRALLLLGFESFNRHPEIAQAIAGAIAEAKLQR